MTTTVIKYVPGDINDSYVIVRNEQTVPRGSRLSHWQGVSYPGQDEMGYGSKITTDLMLQFSDSKRKYRVYATCFSNAASHWIMKGGERLHLPTVFQSDIRDTFIS